MQKTDIEFWNGLTKGIVRCNDILESSSDLEEAKKKMNTLIEKARGKVVLIVDKALD